MSKLKRNIITTIIISLCLSISIISKYEKITSEKNDLLEIKKVINNQKSEYYIVLEIPKINLCKGIYDISNPKNNVDETIEILSSSNLSNNTIILASHSGTASNTYFNNLNKLNEQDKIYIYYDNKKLIYTVKNIKYIPKTGYLEIETPINNSIILITCSLKNSNEQLIVIGTLNNIEKSN